MNSPSKIPQARRTVIPAYVTGISNEKGHPLPQQSPPVVPDRGRCPYPPGEIEIRRNDADKDKVAVKGLPQARPLVQILDSEATAIDIQIAEDAVTEDKHEQGQK